MNSSKPACDIREASLWNEPRIAEMLLKDVEAGVTDDGKLK